MNAALRIAVCLAMLALAGCAGVKTYPDTLPKNLQIATQVESGSTLRTTVAAVDIHRVNARCETEHQGRIDLENGVTDAGVPIGETLYFDFIFASKGVLSPNVSAVRASTLLTPRAGYGYRASVTYKNGIYDVTLRETPKGSAASRVVERRPLTDCKPRG